MPRKPLGSRQGDPAPRRGITLYFSTTLLTGGFSWSVILTTECRTHCSIAPADMNIHKPYLIPPVSMDRGAWCRCLHVNIIAIIEYGGPPYSMIAIMYTVVCETVHTNPNSIPILNPNLTLTVFFCVSVVLRQNRSVALFTLPLFLNFYLDISRIT